MAISAYFVELVPNTEMRLHELILAFFVLLY